MPNTNGMFLVLNTPEEVHRLKDLLDTLEVKG